MDRLKRTFRRIRAKSKETLHKLIHSEITPGQDTVPSEQIQQSPPVANITSPNATTIAASPVTSPTADSAVIKIDLTIKLPVEISNLDKDRTPDSTPNTKFTKADLIRNAIKMIQEEKDAIKNGNATKAQDLGETSTTGGKRDIHRVFVPGPLPVFRPKERVKVVRKPYVFPNGVKGIPTEAQVPSITSIIAMRKSMFDIFEPRDIPNVYQSGEFAAYMQKQAELEKMEAEKMKRARSISRHNKRDKIPSQSSVGDNEVQPENENGNKEGDDIGGRVMQAVSAPKVIADDATTIAEGVGICSLIKSAQPPKHYVDPEYAKSLQKDREPERQPQDSDDDGEGHDVCYHDGATSKPHQTSQSEIKSMNARNVASLVEIEPESVDVTGNSTFDARDSSMPNTLLTLSNSTSQLYVPPATRLSFPSASSGDLRAENDKPSIMEKFSRLSVDNLTAKWSMAVPPPAGHVSIVESSMQLLRWRPFASRPCIPKAQSSQTDSHSSREELSALPHSNGESSSTLSVQEIQVDSFSQSYEGETHTSCDNDDELLFNLSSNAFTGGSTSANNFRSPMKDQDEKYARKVKSWNAKFPTPSKHNRKATTSRDSEIPPTAMEQMDFQMDGLDNIVLRGFQ